MRNRILLGGIASLVSGAAWAHPGHGMAAGFSAGLMHPLTGWDHLLVMLSLGIWAARRPAHQGWQLPLWFVGVMTLSAGLAMRWLPMAVAEGLVAASVLVMGVLLIRRVALPHRWQLAVVGLAAAAHGYVHGLELGRHWSALAGMVLATACLHLLGWWLGQKQHAWLRAATQWLGGGMMVLGAYWLMA